jgi:hypothetical protein
MLTEWHSRYNPVLGVDEAERVLVELVDLTEALRDVTNKVLKTIVMAMIKLHVGRISTYHASELSQHDRLVESVVPLLEVADQRLLV